MDTGYRRDVRRQRNSGESGRVLARRIYHGQRGPMYLACREGREDQLGALGVVLDAAVPENTRYLDAALDQMRRNGHEVDTADITPLTLLPSEHVKFPGRRPVQ